MLAIATCNYPASVPDCNGHSTIFDGVPYLPDEAGSRDMCVLEAGTEEGLWMAELDLNLLRSPQHPDPYADQGRHEFTYALLPHTGNLVASEVQAEAAALNLPPFLAEGFSGGFRQPFAVTADGVSLEVAKKAEKDSDLVLRLVETRGREGAAELRFEQPVTAAETDLLEWNTLAELGTGSLFQLSFKPFEIKTVKVRCAAGI